MKRLSLISPVLGIAFLAALVLPAPVGAISVSGTVVVQEGRVIEEDLFAAGTRVVVDGRIKGDLTVTTRNLVINGVVEGDVNGLAWSIDVRGEVGGSVRAVGWEVDIDGSVGQDVLSFARSLEVRGDVGRDVLLAGLSARHSGTLGGELRGELLWGLFVDGAVAEDIDVGIHRLTITDSATVGSAVSWRQGLIGQNIRGWTARTEISSTADLGLVSEVQPIATDLSVRALRLLFQILRFIGLLFTGILLIHLFPRLSRRATDRAWSRPATTFGIGLGVFVLVPVAAVVSLFTVILAPAGVAGTRAVAVRTLRRSGSGPGRPRPAGIQKPLRTHGLIRRGGGRLAAPADHPAGRFPRLPADRDLGHGCLDPEPVGWMASQGGGNRRPRRGACSGSRAGTAHGAVGIGSSFCG